MLVYLVNRASTVNVKFVWSNSTRFKIKYVSQRYCFAFKWQAISESLDKIYAHKLLCKTKIMVSSFETRLQIKFYYLL